MAYSLLDYLSMLFELTFSDITKASSCASIKGSWSSRPGVANSFLGTMFVDAYGLTERSHFLRSDTDRRGSESTSTASARTKPYKILERFSLFSYNIEIT